MMFRWDAELADEYYLEHYADTNNTMYMCTPQIPMRQDLVGNMLKPTLARTLCLCVVPMSWVL